MVPWQVAVDKRLKHSEVRVFILLAASRRGPDVSIGTRRLAQSLGVGRETVRRSCAALVRCGYLEVDPATKRGRRARYRLTSPIFAVPSMGKESEVDFSFPPLLVVCPRCQRQCRQILKVGWCRSCEWKFKVVAIAQEEIERAAAC